MHTGGSCSSRDLLDDYTRVQTTPLTQGAPICAACGRSVAADERARPYPDACFPAPKSGFSRTCTLSHRKRPKFHPDAIWKSFVFGALRFLGVSVSLSTALRPGASVSPRSLATRKTYASNTESFSEDVFHPNGVMSSTLYLYIKMLAIRPKTTRPRRMMHRMQSTPSQVSVLGLSAGAKLKQRGDGSVVHDGGSLHPRHLHVPVSGGHHPHPQPARLP